MCGIAGFCNFHGSVKMQEENLEKMKQRMLHRGPDAGGSYISEDGKVALGHRRLSIVDLSEAGLQPMKSHSGRYVMVYNGEIYNYKKLSQKLLNEKKVERFRGTSDSEVILEAFEAYGVEEAIAQCKGMFAIALYDTKEQKLYLLRDRIGEKPLYYGFMGDTFVFASDVACIATLDGFKNPVNKDVLGIYFTHGYIPAPYSIYENIYKLEPGCILEIKSPFKKYGISTYWSIKEVAQHGQEHLFRGTYEEAVDELERLLKASIQDQMMADVPVGAFLSAGIDSSTVVALMQSLHPDKVKTFTIGMEDEKYNEAVYAKEIAAYLGTEHTELYITEEDARSVIPKIPFIFGEPFADSSQIPTYLVSRMTREHVTVSLSGDGGDELFCGYNSYMSVDRLWNKIRQVPYGIRKLAGELVLHSPLANKETYRVKGTLLGARGASDLYRLSMEREPIIRKIALSKKELPYKYTEYDPEFLRETNHNIMLMDMLMYHPDDILVKVDRTAMAVSLETRVPMLDKDVVEFAWTLPVEFERQNGVGKRILRDVLYRYVPKEMMERPKKGFSIPIQKWLKEKELREWAENLIDRKTLCQQGILNPDVVWKMWTDFIEKDEWRIQIWYVLIFQEWMSYVL